MFKKPLIIVGIDPGTTLGYAVLDLNNKILEIGSCKEFSLSELISKTIDLGKVVAVGTDKKKVPGFVESFAVKVGAKIISPKEDLSYEFKRVLTKPFKTDNDHQQDALASAIIGYNQLKHLVEKVDSFVKKHKKEHLKDNILELVIKNDGLSIHSALDLIESKSKDSDINIIKNVVEKRDIGEKQFIELYESYKKIKNDNVLLKLQNEKLKVQIGDLTRRIKKPIGKKVDNASLVLLNQKDAQIRFLESKLRIK